MLRFKFILIFISAIIGGNFFSQAQELQIFPRRVSAYQFGSKDFWNADILNNKTQAVVIQLRATVWSQKQEALVEAYSSAITLQPGMNVISPLSVSTGSVKYYREDVREVDISSRSLPPGQYLFCIEAIEQSSKRVLSKACEEIRSEALNPPILISPAHKEQVFDEHPFLTWLPPSPVSASVKLSYSLKLVELTGDQSAADAVRRNRPLFSKTDIQDPSLQYPFTAAPLQYGKTYAWQVEAFAGNFSLGITEAWMFYLSRNEEEPARRYLQQSYVDIQRADRGNVFVALGELKIKYREPGAKGTLNYILRNEKGEQVGPKRNELMTHEGENLFVLPLAEIARMKHKGMYTLELSNADGNTYSLRFTYLDPAAH